MSGSETPRQARLFGDLPDAQATIETEGRVIRPALAPPAALVDELQVHVAPGGLSWRVVDPANVCMCRQHVFPAAFDTYDVTESFSVGLNLPALQELLRRARKGTSTSDPVTCEVSAGRVVARIAREYDIGTVRFADEVLTIEPDKVREEPEEKDMEFDVSAAVSVSAFADVIDWVDTEDNSHLFLRARDGDLLAGRHDSDLDGDGFRLAVTVDDVVAGDDSGEPSALFSLDYLKDVAEGLQTSLATSVTLRWSEQYPLAIDFERERDGQTIYRGRFACAPRITSGGDSDA